MFTVCRQDMFPLLVLIQTVGKKIEEGKKTVLFPQTHFYIIRMLFKIMANCTDLSSIHCDNLGAMSLL